MTRSAWGLDWSSSLARALALAGVLLLAAAPAAARVFMSRSEALATAFPDADRIEARRFVLTETQAERIEARSRAPLESRIVTLHVGWRGQTRLGYALIDIHTVRTLPEALMTVLTPDGDVRSVRVLAFHELDDYLPTRRWFAQFEGRQLDPRLQVNGEIHAVAGATLSARAVTRSVRRALALHQVLIAAPPSSGDAE